MISARPSRPAKIGRADEDLAIESPRPQERRVEPVDTVRRRDHDKLAAVLEPVHLDEQLIERLVLLARKIEAALEPDRVELVDEDDRGPVLLGDREQATDPGCPQPGEHLDERARRLAE